MKNDKVVFHSTNPVAIIRQILRNELRNGMESVIFEKNDQDDNGTRNHLVNHSHYLWIQIICIVEQAVLVKLMNLLPTADKSF